MRREIIQNTVLALVFISMVIGWWVGYVVPKEDVLLAARTCMMDQGIDTRVYVYEQVKPEWDACITQADRDHGSWLLRVFGV